MKRLVVLGLLLACGKKDEPAPPAPPPSGGSAASAASPTQSYREAIERICAIPALPVNAIADVTMRQAEINKWFKATITNPEAIQMYLAIATVQPGDRRAYIRDAATKAGVRVCLYADSYNPSPISVPVPKP